MGEVYSIEWREKGMGLRGKGSRNAMFSLSPSSSSAAVQNACPLSSYLSVCPGPLAPSLPRSSDSSCWPLARSLLPFLLPLPNQPFPSPPWPRLRTIITTQRRAAPSRPSLRDPTAPLRHLSAPLLACLVRSSSASSRWHADCLRRAQPICRSARIWLSTVQLPAAWPLSAKLWASLHVLSSGEALSSLDPAPCWSYAAPSRIMAAGECCCGTCTLVARKRCQALSGPWSWWTRRTALS